AALRFERAEAAIDRRADEEHAAGGHDAAADVRRAGLVEPVRLQRLEEPERYFPSDLAAADVDRDELAEWRRRARNPVLRVPESPDRSAPRTPPHPCRRTTAARRALHHLRNLTEVHHAGERETERRIVRQTVPVAPAERAGECDH